MMNVQDVPLVSVRFNESMWWLDEMNPTRLAGLFSNPVYVGIGHYPPVLPCFEQMFIRAASQRIQQVGAVQYLVDMVYVLRRFLRGEPTRWARPCWEGALATLPQYLIDEEQDARVWVVAVAEEVAQQPEKAIARIIGILREAYSLEEGGAA